VGVELDMEGWGVGGVEATGPVMNLGIWYKHLVLELMDLEKDHLVVSWNL
jgi:hypothetical protein